MSKNTYSKGGNMHFKIIHHRYYNVANGLVSIQAHGDPGFDPHKHSGRNNFYCDGGCEL